MSQGVVKYSDFQQIHGSASQVQLFGANPNRPIENQHVYIYLCRGEKGPKEKLKKPLNVNQDRAERHRLWWW